MNVIKLLQDRIKHSEYQQNQLSNERDELIESLQRLCAKIQEYQNDINEMQVAIEKLEKPESN